LNAPTRRWPLLIRFPCSSTRWNHQLAESVPTCLHLSFSAISGNSAQYGSELKYDSTSLQALVTEKVSSLRRRGGDSSGDDGSDRDGCGDCNGKGYAGAHATSPRRLVDLSLAEFNAAVDRHSPLKTLGECPAGFETCSPSGRNARAVFGPEHIPMSVAGPRVPSPLSFSAGGGCPQADRRGTRWLQRSERLPGSSRGGAGARGGRRTRRAGAERKVRAWTLARRRRPQGRRQPPILIPARCRTA